MKAWCEFWWLKLLSAQRYKIGREKAKATRLRVVSLNMEFGKQLDKCLEQLEVRLPLLRRVVALFWTDPHVLHVCAGAESGHRAVARGRPFHGAHRLC